MLMPEIADAPEFALLLLANIFPKCCYSAVASYDCRPLSECH